MLRILQPKFFEHQDTALTWTSVDCPDHFGRTVVVTGASSGLGAASAEMLAARGARVVLAVRDEAKGEVVRARILALHPRAEVAVLLVDLADLASIRVFAARLNAEERAIDVLINNAGLGAQPRRAVTIDGFERQFGTNHLGAFALTGLLLPSLLKAAAPRVIAVASIAHRQGEIDFADLQGARRYRGLKAYRQSKLANLIFAIELDRRVRAAHGRLVSVAAHPGLSSTGFFAAMGYPKPITAAIEAGIRIMGQDAVNGALPLVYAATMPDVRGGDYWGPAGRLEFRGPPARAAIAPRAHDATVAARLWEVSERLTGVDFDALAHGNAASEPKSSASA